VEQLVLDYKADILLNIYQVGKKFGFRFLASNKESYTGRIDPLNHSENFSWGYGYFDSPDHAQSVAHEYYLTHGIHQLRQAVEKV
jgi:hypothetical protein